MIMSIIETALDRTKKKKKKSGDAQPGDTVATLLSIRTAPAAHARTLAPRGGATIDFSAEALTNHGLLPVQEMRRRHLDEFRAIKRPLLDTAFADSAAGTRAGAILVTSSTADEGKSYTSLHLALSLAQEESCHVTLIDADAPRRCLTQVFAPNGRPGLLDYLKQHERRSTDVISATSVPNLWFVPAGTYSPSATELYAGPRMEAFIAQLLALSPRHLVVIDAAPMLLTSETQVLARTAGQFLFVVRAASTLQDMVTDAVSRLPAERPIGLVLNRWRPLAFSEREYYGRPQDDEAPLER